jgi:rhodanese-related sulfurtransferase
MRMKSLTTATRLALLAVISRPSTGFLATKSNLAWTKASTGSTCSAFHRVTPKAFMSSSSGGAETSQIKHIGRSEMEEILEDFEAGGREDSQYVVVDVRTGGEIVNTGKLSPSVYSVPIEVIMEHDVFQLDEDDFEEICGFAKPMPDETLVFTCAAGIRSVYACQFAAKAGYSKLVNYVGGSNDWFQPRQGF